uniref:Kinesin-like protein n=1 Tax=Caenorhabditis tropicalis TaxID=1561998 RepID=A0A1I7UM49_9PELO
MSSRKRGITPSRDPVRRKKSSLDETDNIEVFCRLCPYSGSNPSLVAIDEKSVKTVLPPPQFRRENAPQVEKIFGFGRVFSEEDGQEAVFEKASMNLIIDLLKGQNSLLFTYGVTGSGKTYTMTGKPTERDTGLLPRTLDVIFNSVNNRVEKCVFYPAALNTFEIRSTLDAHMKRHQMAADRLSTSREITDRYYEAIKLSGYNDDMVCSVFVSYVEIYNNYCYDLLEDAKNGSRVLSKRELRHDRQQQIYVDGAKEVEVSSSEEALEVFCLGEERRRVSSTLLNKDSSRSHSVFTIKLVMAPRAYDSKNVYPVMDSSQIIVSQMCLVDLAGSERAKRTQNAGERLAEANSINQSLMNLRQCIDVLRRNQKSNSNMEQVPYRQSKLTHLFKNYLEGNGKIRMVICVNPKPEDYDENMSALAFAEESQAIEVKKQVERLPSERIPHSFFTQWNIELDSSVRLDDGRSETPCPPTFCLRDYNDNETVESLRTYARKLSALQSSSDDGTATSLVAFSRQYMLEADYQRMENNRLKDALNQKDEEIEKLRAQCRKYKHEKASLKARNAELEQAVNGHADTMKILMDQKAEDNKIIQSQKKAMRNVRGIMDNPSPSVASLRSRFDQENMGAHPTAPMQTPPPPYQTPGRQGVFKKRLEATTSTTAVNSAGSGANGQQGYVNPKYQRRSKSASRLLDHQPLHRVPTGTVLQSRTPGNAITTTKPELSQLNKSGEYRLTHQEVDQEGNISTNIVKVSTNTTALLHLEDSQSSSYSPCADVKSITIYSNYDEEEEE